MELRKMRLGGRDSSARRNKDAGLRRHRGQGEVCKDLGVHAIMKVTHAPLRFLDRGAVVRASFPFVDGADSKVRPAVVIGKSGRQVCLMQLTTSKRTSFETDVDLLDLAAAGLHRATTARRARLATVDYLSVIEVLGHLSARDEHRVLASPSAA
jgi:hypothetical protein